MALPRLSSDWFPVAAVDRACGSPAGSGQNEKAIFTWFASRPIAQARAAVLCSLLTEDSERRRRRAAPARRRAPSSPATGRHSRSWHHGSRMSTASVQSSWTVSPDAASSRLRRRELDCAPVGLDLSPVAALAARLLADWPFRDWSSEPEVPFDSEERDDHAESSEAQLFVNSEAEPKLIRDLRRFFAEVGRRVAATVEPYYPRNPDRSYPWGYLWAITLPCDACQRSLPTCELSCASASVFCDRRPGAEPRLEIQQGSKDVGCRCVRRDPYRNADVCRHVRPQGEVRGVPLLRPRALARHCQGQGECRAIRRARGSSRCRSRRCQGDGRKGPKSEH